MNNAKLKALVIKLAQLPRESEWIEFKHNFHSGEEIGQRISALANGACIHHQPFGYLVFGVEDHSHKLIGTSFRPKSKKIGKHKEELENWLVNRLSPKLDFRIYEVDHSEDIIIVMFVIPAARNKPVAFSHISYIRVGSATRRLSEFAEKEAKIWREKKPQFEVGLAKHNLSSQDVVQLLATHNYFELLNIPYPSTQEGVIEKFVEEGLVVRLNGYAITNLGALLFAKLLSDFEGLNRKAIRVVVYTGNNKIHTEREQIGKRGYSVGFLGLVNWVNSQLPANEEIGKALRQDTRMYPQVAIRELVANALIHQDFSVKGFPIIEIYSDRIEMSNPGAPLITPDRFIDSYVSRNEKLADLMRRMGFCEEKGSGLDKVVFNNELYQLPAINVTVDETHTKVTMYSYRELKKLDKKDKIRACYQHACLKYVSNEKMTNQSLRERFKIKAQNYATASRIIKEAILTGKIKEEDPTNKSRKYASYLPFWA